MVEIMQKLQGLQEMLKWPRHSRMCATIKKRQTKIAFKNVATRSSGTVVERDIKTSLEFW